MERNRKTLVLALLLATSHAYVSTTTPHSPISLTHQELLQLTNDLKKSSSLQDTLENLNYLALYLEGCLDLTDENDNTLLMLCAQQGFNQLANLLLNLGADPNARDYMGQTALTWAAFHNNTTLAKILVNHQADVNAPGRHGWTVLHWAVYNNNQDLVSFLLAHKADITIKNNEGLTPIDCAQMYASQEIIELLTQGATSTTADSTTVCMSEGSTVDATVETTVETPLVTVETPLVTIVDVTTPDQATTEGQLTESTEVSNPDEVSSTDQSTTTSQETTTVEQPASQEAPSEVTSEETPVVQAHESETSIEAENNEVVLDETIAPVDSPVLDAILEGPLTLNTQTQG